MVSSGCGSRNLINIHVYIQEFDESKEEVIGVKLEDLDEVLEFGWQARGP